METSRLFSPFSSPFTAPPPPPATKAPKADAEPPRVHNNNLRTTVAGFDPEPLERGAKRLRGINNTSHVIKVSIFEWLGVQRDCEGLITLHMPKELAWRRRRKSRGQALRRGFPLLENTVAECIKNKFLAVSGILKKPDGVECLSFVVYSGIELAEAILKLEHEAVRVSA